MRRFYPQGREDRVVSSLLPQHRLGEKVGEARMRGWIGFRYSVFGTRRSLERRIPKTEHRPQKPYPVGVDVAQDTNLLAAGCPQPHAIMNEFSNDSFKN